ncbi:serine/threonine-protein kinase-like protein ccr4 [Quercus suber]|uniref:Serine/threonine-protein kinase-like protein ccr4 n=1 Tax=Quercus suber TaxID=58331 RepID=A0AAW0MCW0_QUESU
MLLEATNNFSKDCKIKTNGFGSLYRAILDDGREVAIHHATLTAKLSNFNISVTSDIHYEPIAGTPGYLDPEYLISGNLTTEVDVYSFGVVLLEMLSGLKAIHTTENGELRLIVDFVVPYIAKKEIHRFLDPKVPPPTPLEMEALAFVVSLALDCVSKERVLRPSMTKVANRLQSALEGILEGQGNCWVQKELDG